MTYIKYQQYLCVYLELGSPAVTFCVSLWPHSCARISWIFSLEIVYRLALF